MTAMEQTPHPTARRQQSGFLLVEVLVAILIFAIGVLSLVGLRATAIQQASDANYRAQANLLANDLIGRMWGSDRSVAALQANFNSDDGAGYAAWLPNVEAALPGAADHPPAVSITADCAPVVPCGGAEIPSSLVTVDIAWQPPGDAASAVRHLTVVTRIK